MATSLGVASRFLRGSSLQRPSCDVADRRRSRLPQRRRGGRIFAAWLAPLDQTEPIELPVPAADELAHADGEV